MQQARDLLTAVLFDWSDLVRLRAVLAALNACLVALRGDDGACDTLFVTTRPLVAVTRDPPLVATPAHALETLARDCCTEDPPRERRALLVASVRATFLVLFWLDGRVRRWVMAPGTACHAATRTRAPERVRVMAWARAGAADVARQYAEDLFLIADGHEPQDQGASPGARVQALTHDFVAFMQHWWATGLPAVDAHARALMRDAAAAAEAGTLDDEARRRRALQAAHRPPSPRAADMRAAFGDPMDVQ